MAKVKLLKYLLVDSKTTRRHTLENILVALGIKPADLIGVSDPSQLPSLMRSRRFECMFIHADGSSYNWLELLKAVRGEYSDNELQLVLLDSEPTKERVMVAYENGINGVIRYPCSVNDVEMVLKLVKR